ncbi:hypothetical protein OH773_06700 [Buttiauxella sp. WJP83]|uniref:hypothetical protein n=1 Tax=Buttiauxella sp. WJP83 TaxID=2986951 RepID=UPI0022DE35E8|nr:hypothetical protein [Buttiauxella sp. WJP83]WBM71924.1 hypothetical protein OH773_06700 [Buttiauxella sp. WJP83]
MADRQTLLTALRNAHNAGDTAGATRIAGMIKALPSQTSPEAPQAPQGATNPTTPEQPQNAVQSDTGASTGGFMQGVTDTLKASGRIAAGAVSDVANVGVGVVNAGLSAADWAAEQAGGNIDYRLPSAGYGDSEFSKEYLTPQTTGERVVASLPSYVVGGEVVAPVKAAANAGRVAKFTTSVINNLPSAISGEFAEHNQGDLSAGNIALNTVAPAVIEKVGGAAVRGVRNMLPENFGGYSVAEKTANVVKPEAVERVLQGGNQEAQQAYRTATTDAQGNSILLPSQVMNNQAGDKYIAAESRDMLRGDKSEYNQRLAQQQSGEGITQAVTDANAGAVPLQDSAQNITGQFKQQSNKLYNESKSNAQDILDSRNVTEMHFRNTKDLAAQHLEADAQAGKINLNAETRRTLTQLQKTKFDSIDTLDAWKRALSEKANKAYRNGDYTSSSTLKGVLDNLRGEADATIQSIDPAAGSIYRDADTYFKESVGDFGSGKKSVLGKMADKENPQTATNVLVRGQNAEFHANQIGDAMDSAIASGSLDNAATLATEFGSSLGSATRETALGAATTGANFSPTKFANTLNRLDPQVSVATRFAADEQAVNDALLDAVQLTRAKARSTGRITNVLASGVGRTVGAGVGGALGSTLGGVGAGLGALAGNSAAKVVGEGLLDRLTGTLGRGNKYIQFLSDPANAKLVSDVLANQGGLNATTDAITRAIDSITQSTATNYSSVNSPSVSPSVNTIAPVTDDSTPEPVQHAQVAKREANTTDNFDPKVTKLYKALAHAETGGLDNRFIRTKAAESGVSTAYGAAQLTVSTLDDFYKRNSGLFNAKERDYIKRFSEQGQMMKHAAHNDPVFGYGGSGVLGGKEDRKLYAAVVRKMLQKMIKDNNGSLDKTVMQWRGNNNDHAYFAKVRNAYRNS